MGRRLRFFKPDKHQKLDWETPGWMGLFIILCVTMVMTMYWLPSLMKAFGPRERVRPAATTSLTEDMQDKEGTHRVPPKATLLSRYRERAGLLVLYALMAAAAVGILVMVYRLSLSAATPTMPRRWPSGPLELVPDEKAREEGEEPEEPEQKTQHLTPEPERDTTSEKKADEEKNAEEP